MFRDERGGGGGGGGGCKSDVHEKFPTPRKASEGKQPLASSQLRASLRWLPPRANRGRARARYEWAQSCEDALGRNAPGPSAFAQEGEVEGGALPTTPHHTLPVEIPTLPVRFKSRNLSTYISILQNKLRTQLLI